MKRERGCSDIATVNRLTTVGGKGLETTEETMIQTIYHTSGLRAVLLGVARIFDFGTTIGNAELRSLLYEINHRDMVKEAWEEVGRAMRLSIQSSELVRSGYGETTEPEGEESITADSSVTPEA